MNTFLALVLRFFGRKAEEQAHLYCETSPTKQHAYECLGKYLIPAKAIKPSSRLNTKLKCHYCPATVGPKRGHFVSEEV